MRISDWSSDVCSSDLGGHRSCADQLLTRFEGDVGHLARRCVHLVQRAIRIGIDLNRVEIAGPAWLNAGRAIGGFHPCARVGRLRCLRGGRWNALQLSSEEHTSELQYLMSIS